MASLLSKDDHSSNEIEPSSFLEIKMSESMDTKKKTPKFKLDKEPAHFEVKKEPTDGETQGDMFVTIGIDRETYSDAVTSEQSRFNLKSGSGNRRSSDYPMLNYDQVKMEETDASLASKCKECLRSQCRKHMNKKIRSGQVATNSLNEDQMLFLSGFMKDRTRITSQQQAGNNSDSGSEENDEVDEATSLPQHKHCTAKRKMQENNISASATLMRYLLEKQKEERAPELIETFFSLMAATAKKFSPADQHFIKTKVFSLVSEIEAKYIHN